MSRTHRLKTLPQFWDRAQSGQKTFEIRLNDRDYQLGDILELQLFDGKHYVQDGLSRSSPIKTIRRRVAYILSHFEGLAPGYVAMAVEPIEEVSE